MDTTSISKLEGRYFPAGISKSDHAELVTIANTYSVQLLETREKIPVEFSSLGDRLGNLPRKIYFQDGSVFECDDNDAVDEMFDAGRGFFSRLAIMEGSFRFALIAVVLSVLALVGLFRYGLPAVANLAASVTPTPVILLIDDSALETVDTVLFEPSTLGETRKAELSAIFDELVIASEHTSPPLKMLFRDGGRLGANAVALPGGTIILTDQLVALAKNDDELAGVMAHEIGHVTERHSLRQIYRALGIAFMASVIVGDSSQLIEEVVAQAALLDTLSYSREFEIHADIESVRIMHKAGRDPIAFVDLLDRLLEEYGIDPEKDNSSWISTHPGNKDRRAAVQAEIDALNSR